MVSAPAESQQARDPRKATVSVQVQRQKKTYVFFVALRQAQALRQEFPFIVFFGLFRPSADWVQPTHVREGTPLYSA